MTELVGAAASRSSRRASGYPTVLVVAHNPFTWSLSNGTTLSSLFRGWPKDRLAQVFIPFAHPVAPMFDVCERFWALTPTGLQRLEPKAGHPTETLYETYGPARWARQRIGASQSLLKIAYPARELLYSLPHLLRGAELEQIRRFAPDVVFSTLGTLCCCNLTLRLADQLDCAIVPFVTDDWL